jgi:hypothetical protein
MAGSFFVAAVFFLSFFQVLFVSIVFLPFVWTKNSLLYSKYPKGKTNHVHLSILVKTDTFAQNLDNFPEDTLPIPKNIKKVLAISL